MDIAAILRQKEVRSSDYALLLFRMTSRVLYSAQHKSDEKPTEKREFIVIERLISCEFLSGRGRGGDRDVSSPLMQH